ncbi:hypothetical protein GC089_18190 [Cellulomonas sp. JZ18]|uniref:hypothetical protein n=1 Tax=Cellulomonas sp. JZ18 TaxID=2654191 RepID=UPI0012D3A637|nr:hypothetical protein [Cellulomonas sp. JZ18]QGQ20768.1 hypothetical protein GC089_18190 [Cellulomonas sp. JZ18]
MNVSISVSAQEVTGLADALDGVGAEYGCPALPTTGTGAESTGHVELAQALPQFCQFTSEVLNALVANLMQHAEQLREASRLYCSADDGASSAVDALRLPAFDAHLDQAR